MPKAKTDWSIGLVILAFLLIATGFVFPLHTLKIFAPHDIGGDTTSYIEAQPLNIRETVLVDGSFAWMDNHTYSQFYAENMNLFTDQFFASLGMIWCVFLALSILFGIISITIGRTKGYSSKVLILSILCLLVAIAVFYSSYGHMLSSIAGHASFSGAGHDVTGNVDWTSTPGYGFYLPCFGCLFLLGASAIEYSKKH